MLGQFHHGKKGPAFTQHHGRGKADADGAALRERQQTVVCVAKGGAQVLRFLGKYAACRSEYGAGVIADKKRRAQFLFQRFDAVGDGGLGHE